MAKTTKAHVSIDLRDVVAAGSVSQAIIDWSKESDDTSSGVIGSTFSCSGPGSGWQKNHDASDYAERALDAGYGALYYLDADDGRLAKMAGKHRYAIVDAGGEYVTDGGNRTPASDEAQTWDHLMHAHRHLEKMEDDEDGYRATDKVVALETAEVEWSDESVVELVCPDIDDAIEYPSEVADMAQAVIDYHGPMSDKAEWKKLVESIKAAAEALEDIDADDLRLEY